MGETNELVWYMNFDWSMIWACLAASLLTILFISIQGKKLDQTKGVNSYLKPTWKNHLYHIGAGLVMLTFISEVGLDFVKKYVVDMDVETSNDISHLLAVFSGLAGGFVLAKIIRLIQKLN